MLRRRLVNVDKKIISKWVMVWIGVKKDKMQKALCRG